jgi:hypothetical protein
VAVVQKACAFSCGQVKQDPPEPERRRRRLIETEEPSWAQRGARMQQRFLAGQQGLGQALSGTP